jgi:probable phosphoglycerate mutase
MRGKEWHLELIIVRHGQTAWTLSGRHTGRTDVPLTAAGRQEAAALAPILVRHLDGRVPVVFTSPRLRAVETARLCMPHRDVTVEPLLAEFDLGDYEGLTLDQIHVQAPGWDIWRHGCPGGETTAAAGARADEFLAARVSGTDAPVVAVTHGHLSPILAARALRRPAGDGSMFAISTGSVSVIKTQHDRPSLYRWNMTAR